MASSTNKEPVRLRRKKLANGNVSLYLDIYWNGVREYEFLKLYLIPEKTKADRETNRATLQMANSVKSTRILEIQNGEYGFKQQFADQTLFFEYYRALTEKRLGQESRGNWGNWFSALKHLEAYEPNKRITFAQITPAWINGFHEYLDKKAIAFGNDKRERTTPRPISQNTKQSYFNKLRACLRQAYEDQIIRFNPMRGIDGFNGEEGTRMYLTIDELRRMVAAECDFPEIKRAFLFSCLTGLRRSDILKLTWGEVHQQGEYTRIIFRQKKTKGQEYIDLAPQAADLLGERGKHKSTDYVFGDIFTPSSTNQYIRLWAMRAGITKNISFHCGRHTFATMMLDIGTDIYTVSKLLGHRFLSTTQIYAKVMDKNKQSAVMRIPDLSGATLPDENAKTDE